MPLRLTAAQYRAYKAPADVESVVDLVPMREGPPVPKPRKRRSKGEQILNPYEHSIQRAVVKQLRALLAPGYIVQAFVSEHQSADEKIKAKNAGQDPGWPDLGVFGDGRCWLIEMKDRDGRLSEDQKKMHPRIVAAGITLLPICRNLETAVVWLRENGARLRCR